jgi:hypothetical protein
MLLALSLVLLSVQRGPPVRVEALTRETPDGPVRAWIARVGLTDPRVSFVVTGPMAPHAGDPRGAEARLVPTAAWAEQAGVDLAVKANFFARLDGPGAPPSGWTDALPVDAPRTLAADRRDRRPLPLHRARGGGGRGRARRRRGRGGGDERTLLLLVVDGRQPGWSVGATLPELAALLAEAGPWNALALDGGGSTAMWYRELGAPAGRVLNRPSDGRVRPVASHLGVRSRSAPE